MPVSEKAKQVAHGANKTAEPADCLDSLKNVQSFASFRCGGMKIPVYWAICYPDGRKRFLGYEKQRKRICATQTASSAAPKLNRNRPTQYLKSMRCPPSEPTHIKRWVFLCSTVFCLAVGSLEQRLLSVRGEINCCL